MSELLHQFVDYVVELVQGFGYIGIFLLMTLESSFVPFPSEVVLIPAGYLASTGQMSALYVVLAGVGGSLLGAYINYYLSLYLGRSFILKFGNYFFLPESKFLALEEMFLKHGKFATFVGRLIFGIRQWISIPAGLSRMPIIPFSLLTSGGAGLWVIILVSLGYILGEGEEASQMAKLIGYWLLGVIAILTVAYFYWWSPKKKLSNEKAPTDHAANGGTSVAS